jgi:hypothetical protein
MVAATVTTAGDGIDSEVHFFGLGAEGYALRASAVAKTAHPEGLVGVEVLRDGGAREILDVSRDRDGRVWYTRIR